MSMFSGQKTRQIIKSLSELLDVADGNKIYHNTPLYLRDAEFLIELSNTELTHNDNADILIADLLEHITTILSEN